MGWVDNPDKWPKLAERLRAAGEFGLDTETYGQPDRTSPQHRTRIHCWSVGVLTGEVTPRGYRRGVGVVLPLAALSSPELLAVLADPRIKKWAHNAPHDRHSLENHGVTVRSMEDSLQWFRVAVPGMADYGLKGLEQWALGYPKRPDFLDMVSYEYNDPRSKRTVSRWCSCGIDGCRKRSNGHSKHSLRRFTPVPRIRQGRYQVTDFVPGAQLTPMSWTPALGASPVLLDRLEEWWKYSLADAVRGMEAVDWLRNRRPNEVKYPWQRH